jgi:hypothetical protein
VRRRRYIAGASANYFLFAGAFLAADFFLAGAFLAADFFLAGAFLAADFFLAGAFFADDFLEADFFAALATVVLLSMESRESAHVDIVIRLMS